MGLADKRDSFYSEDFSIFSRHEGSVQGMISVGIDAGTLIAGQFIVLSLLSENNSIPFYSHLIYDIR